MDPKNFLFFVTCIYVDGINLPPVLIYKNKSHNLQDIWFEDFDYLTNKAYFSAFLKSWTNDALKIS